MPPDVPLPDTAAASAWAREMRAIRAALGRAIADGQMSRALAAPEPVLGVLLSLLDDVDCLSQADPVPRLATVRDPQFGAWAHYHRVVRTWITEIIDSGLIPDVREPRAAAFENWLLHLATIPDTSGISAGHLRQ